MDKFSTPNSALHTAQRPLEDADPAVVPPKRPRGRPPKTSDERDDGNRRQALLSAAAKLFRTQGFDATTTRDIATAVGMHSGSPFYHFKSKGELLFAVMEEGMRAAIVSQAEMLCNSEHTANESPALLALLVQHHLAILLGPDADFVPVMLYEFRSLNPQQRQRIHQTMNEYEAAWVPVLQALHDAGRLGCDVKLARLMILGALNWTTQWFDPRQATQGGASLDDLTTAAIALFLNKDTA